MSEKYENYIKDLSPELQQKAKECKSKEDKAEPGKQKQNNACNTNYKSVGFTCIS